MRNRIFFKANLLQKKIVEVGQSGKGKYFQFEINNSPGVSIKVEDNMTIMSCTCKQCSTNSVHPGLLCSYKLAILLFELNKCGGKNAQDKRLNITS